MHEDDDADEDDKGMSATRYPCMPSLVALQQMKNRLHLAHLGKKLMKWTAQATVRELRRIAQDISIQYEGFKDEIRQAFILLARSRFYLPFLNRIVLENVPNAACLHITTTTRSVSGVKLYVLEVVETPEDPYVCLGIEKGGQTITETKIAWRELLKKMIFITELRKGFMDVDLANKTATKRCNVIKRILIPKLKKTIAYILSELEEREREETFRIKQFKKLKDKKKKKDEKLGDKVHICTCCLNILKNDKEMAEKLCDICKTQDSGKKLEIFDASEPCNLEDGTMDIRLRLETLTNHIDEVIGLTKVYTREGLVSPSMEKFIKTCHAVKEKIEDAGGILPICEVCKQEMKKSERTEIPQIETPKSGKSVVSDSSKKMAEEPTDSIYNLGSDSTDKFGYFEKKFKEIVKVTRLKKDDGTVSEEKQVITIRTERRNPKKPGSESFDGRNNDPYLGPGGYDGDSKKNFRLPRNAKSEHTGHSDNMGEPTLRPTMSAGFQKPNKDESTNNDASTCCSVILSPSNSGKTSSHTCEPRTESNKSKLASEVTSETSVSITRSNVPRTSTSSAQTCCKELPVEKPAQALDQTCSCNEIPAQAPDQTCSCKEIPVQAPDQTCSCKEIPAQAPDQTCSCKEIPAQAPVQTCSCKEIPAQAPVQTCSCIEIPAQPPVQTCSCKEIPAQAPVQTCSCKGIPAQAPVQTCSCKEIPAQPPAQIGHSCCPNSCHGDAVERRKSEDKKSVCFLTAGTDAVWRDSFSSTTEPNVEPSCRSCTICGTNSKEPTSPLKEPTSPLKGPNKCGDTCKNCTNCAQAIKDLPPQIAVQLPVTIKCGNNCKNCTNCAPDKQPPPYDIKQPPPPTEKPINKYNSTCKNCSSHGTNVGEPQSVEKPNVKCRVKIVPKTTEEKTPSPPPSKVCCSDPSTKEQKPNKEKQICLQGSLVDILKTIVLPKSNECSKCPPTKVAFTEPEKPTLICKSCISKLSSFVAKQDLDNASIASDTSSCKVCQACEESNEQEMDTCMSKPDSSPSLSYKSLAVGSSSEDECCQPKAKTSTCCGGPPKKPKKSKESKKPPPCCKDDSENEKSSSEDEKGVQASTKQSPCGGKAQEKHKKPHICCIDKEKDEDLKGVSCCALAAKLSAKSAKSDKSAKSAKSSKSSKSGKSEKSAGCSAEQESSTCPSQQIHQSDCCETKEDNKDAATSTKRTDKFDVRSLKNLKCPKKSSANKNKKACTCVSEPIIGGKNTDSDANTLFKKSKSCEHEHYELFFRW